MTVKHIRRRLCALLGVCLLAALLAPAASAKAAPAPCGCGEVLQVFLRGFVKPLYYNQGTPYQITAGPLAHILINKQGNSLLPVTKDATIDPAQDHTKNPEYEFVYDYRTDIFVLADLLHDFIEELCARTGHEKIALTVRSWGSNIGMTYLSQYGTRRLEAFILFDGVYNGTSLAGDLMTNNLLLSGEALINALASLNHESAPLAAFADVLRATPLANLNYPLSRNAGAPVGLAGRVVIDPLLLILMRQPCLWVILPESYYKQAYQMLENHPEYAYTRAVADRYYKEVQTQVPRLIKECKASGVKTAIVCSYGKAPIPLLGSTGYQGDYLVDVELASCGATAASMRQTLPPSNSAYRSPDGIIDASTCLLPDNTWFVKYNSHFDCPRDLQQWIIHSKKQPTIHDTPKFPQYLVVTDEEDTTWLDGESIYTAPLEEEPAVPFTGTFLEASRNFVQTLW